MTATAVGRSPDRSRPSGGRPGARRLRRRGRGLGILLVLPAVVLLVLFLLWPIVTSVRYSFTSASGFGDMDPVGAANYGRALTDTAFYAAFGRNVLFAVIVLVASLVVGFVVAYLLYLRVKGWRALQVLLMIPYIMPVVVVALLWRFILQPDNGLLNSVLRGAHLGFLAGPWLTGEGTSLGSVALVQIWVTIPFAILLIFGAMLSLPSEVLEAAEIDGAGHVARMFRVVLPMVRATVLLTAFVITINLFRSFDLVYLLTKGGPISSSTIATLYVFVTGFVSNEYGYANALGVVLGVVLVLLALIPRVVSALRARRERRRTGDRAGVHA